MVKEVIMYTIVCDGCGKDVNDDTEYSGWNDVGYLEEIRYEADWGKVDDEHYCTDCFERDDDFEIVIKNKKL
jgi:hypothetical protein